MDANIQLFKEGHVERGGISTAKSVEVIVAWCLLKTLKMMMHYANIKTLTT